VEDTSRHPVYIRMSDRCGFPAGGWNLDYAEVRLNPGPAQIVFNRLGAINDGVYLWLAAETGLALYLVSGSQLVDPVPPSPPCPLGRKCCELEPSGECRRCVPEGASCP
jgi:hypothetical protein